MVLALVLSLLTVILTGASALLFPSISLRGRKVPVYPFIPLLGAILILSFGLVPWERIEETFLSDTAVNPLRVLVLFFSMVFLSTLLDEEGFFSHLAGVALRHGGKSQGTLFAMLFLFVSLLTVFTSNDIIVLTFTPFLISFCRRTRVDPVPYLIGSFVAANTFSAFLPVGNPTNIFLTESLGISWADYLLRMSLPSLLSGLLAFLILRILFRRELRKPLIPMREEPSPLHDRPSVIVSLIALGLAILGAALGSFLPIPSYLICLALALLLFLFRLVRGILRKDLLPPLRAVRRLPYSLLPLLLGMFVVVLALDEQGITSLIAGILNQEGYSIWSHGLGSMLLANLMNNIPMSVLFEEVFLSAPYEGLAPYAVILSSNLAAYLTPFGALAGLMFLQKVREEGIPLTFLRFTREGLMVAVPALLIGLLALQAEAFLFV